MTDEIPRKERRIPEHKLRELIEKWERVTDIPEPDELCERNKGVYNATLSCADELEALLGEP